MGKFESTWQTEGSVKVANKSDQIGNKTDASTHPIYLTNIRLSVLATTMAK